MLGGRGVGSEGFPPRCRCAGVQRSRGRVTTNVFVRDMDLAVFDVKDSRRLEVVADGLTAFRGAQLAIDTTLVSALRRDGTARPGAATRAGVALAAARTKERTYPELTGDPTQSGVSPRTPPRPRGCSMVATMEHDAAKAFAQSLLGRQAPGCGDNIPSEAEVVRDDRFA